MPLRDIQDMRVSERALQVVPSAVLLENAGFQFGSGRPCLKQLPHLR